MPAKIPKPTIPIDDQTMKNGSFEVFEDLGSEKELILSNSNEASITTLVAEAISRQKSIQDHLKNYLLAVEKTGCSSSTIRNYKSDINQFLDFIDSQDINDLGNKPKLLAFAHYQRDKGLKENSVKRKLVSITQFKIWLKDQGLLSSEIPLRIFAETDGKDNKNDDLQRKIIDHRGQISPNETQIPDKKIQIKAKKPGSRLLILLNLIALFLFLGGLAYFAYQQFGQAIISMAYPSAPTAPQRVLSYQGRLTNTAQSPISVPTDMTYALYNADTGGTLLWSSNTCSIDPDQDGIFNANLGAGAGTGADNENCGGSIAESVFTENTNVWLEVAIGAEVLTPRQPIRTVPYALNAGTLQGLPPAEIATNSTILMMNNAGEVVLGTDNPVIKAATTSSGMTIEANKITIKTTAASNGNIILAPDGTGILDIQGNASVSGETTLVGNTYVSSPNTLIFGGTTALGEISSPTDSGAFLIGAFDEFSYSNSNNVQGVLKDIDSTIANLSSGTIGIWTDSGDLTYLTSTTDDWAVGGNSLTAALSVDVSANTLRLGTGATANSILNMYASNGSTGSLTYTTNDSWAFEGGSVGVGTAAPAASALLDLTSTSQGFLAPRMTTTQRDAISSPATGLMIYNTTTNQYNVFDGLIWGAVGGGAPGLWLDSGLGSISPNNTTWDLLIGGASTASAKFAFNNVSGGTPTLSFANQASAINLANSTVNSLNIEGGLMSFDTSNSRVGVGTTAPAQKLDVAGNIVATNGYFTNELNTSFSNMIRNGSAENSTTYWYVANGAGSDGAISAYTSDSYFGPTSLRYTRTTFVGWSVLENLLSTYLPAPYFDTNKTYTLSFYTKSLSGTPTLSTSIRDGSGINAVTSCNNVVLSSSWQQLTCTFTPALTGVTPVLYLTANSPAAVDILVDGVMLTTGSQAYGYTGLQMDKNDSASLNKNLYVAGNVGIGVPSPTQALDVNGVIINNTYAYLGGTTSTGLRIGGADPVNTIYQATGNLSITAASGNKIYLSKVSAPTTGLTVDTTSGSVGIGTTSPISTLSVGATSQFQVNSTGNIVKINNVATSFPATQGSTSSVLTNDGSGNLSWANPSGGTGISGYWQRTAGSLAPTNITDSINLGNTATASALVHLAGTAAENSWINTGRFGIGTMSPNSILEVLTTTSEGAQFTKASGNFNTRFGRPGNASDANGIISWDDTNKQLQFMISGDTAGTSLNVANGGNVGIGITNPSKKLEVFGTAAVSAIQATTNSYNGTDSTSAAPEKVFFNVPGGPYTTQYFKIARIKATGTYAYSAITGWLNVGGGHTGLQRKIDLEIAAYTMADATTSVIKYAKNGNNTDYLYVYNINDGDGAGTDYYDVYVKLGWYDRVTGELDITGRGFNATSAVTLWQTGLDAGATAPTDTLVASSSNYNFDTTGNVGVGTIAPASMLSVGASSQFQVNSSGDMVKIKNLTYAWPSAHAAGMLKDDGAGTLSWSTISSTEIADNSLDFVDFQDTLDLDANLILNQGAYTWTQNYTGTTGTGFTYNANSLTSGKGMYLLSTSTGLTGSLAEFELSGNNAANTGNVLRLAQTGASSAAVPLMVTNLGTGASFRVNDETGDADTTPFIVDNAGNVGIGLTNPTSKLQIGGASSTISNDTGDIVLNAASGNISLSGGNLTNATNGLFSGSLGVGTATPIFQTEIYGAGQLTAAMTDAGNRTGILAINGNSTTAGAGGAIVFGNSSSHTANSLGFAAIKGLLTDSTAKTIGALAFSTRAATSSTALTERMRITSSGFVGIGTDNPSEMLGVNGSIVAEKYYDLTNKNYYLDPAAVGTSLKLAGNAEIEGNIGIGAAATGYKLSISGATSVIANTTGDITIDPASGNLSLAGNNIINAANGSFVNGYFSNTVGIGTVTPGAKLEINSATNGSGYGLKINTNTRTSGEGYVWLGDATTPDFYINTTGNVGIGNITPQVKLHITIPSITAVPAAGTYGGAAIFGNDLSTYGMYIGSISNGNGYIQQQRGDSATTYNLLLQPNGGNVGIGAGTANGRLDVNTYGSASGYDGLVTYQPADNQTTIQTYIDNQWANRATYAGGCCNTLYINPDVGTVWVAGVGGGAGVYINHNGTAWVSGSDERLKTNIQSFSENKGLASIMQLNPVTFNWVDINSSQDQQTGFLAQQMQTIFPELVSLSGNETTLTLSDGSKQTVTNPLGVNYQGLIVPLVKAVQELNAKIDDSSFSKNSQFANLIILDSNGDVVMTGDNANTYAIATPTGIADRIAVFADVFTARLQAGFIKTKELIADTFTANSALISNLIAPNLETDTIISSDGQIDIVSNATISGSLAVNGESKLGQLIADNASISGELSAEQARINELEANSARMNSIEAKLANIENATVSGTLYAENIEANSISADVISGLKERLAEQIAETLTQPTLIASLFAQQNTQTDEYLNQLSQEINAEASSSATASATLAEIDANSNNSTLIADNAFINQYFEVNGNAYIANSLKLGQNLMIGNDTAFGTNYISYQPTDTEDFTFYIQPAGMGKLSLMAGLMELDHQGFITINGDLKVAGALEVGDDLKVKGTLLTNMISAETPGEDIRVQLSNAQQGSDSAIIMQKSDFEFIDETKTPVATVSANGDLALTGSLRINQNPTTASESGELVSGRSAGQAVLQAGATEITIMSDKVEENSMIYVTPLNSTNNQVLYVKNKITDSSFTPENDGQFTVAIDYVLGHNVTFNWWIIQLN
jgi:hypothetical protein